MHCSQFHQSYTFTHFVNILRIALTSKDHKSAKNTVESSVFFALLGSERSKAAHKPLMKLTPACTVVNFTNILRTAFTSKDHKSAKNTVKSSVFFALLGSERSKAAHKPLMKLTPACTVVNFTNILTNSFYERRSQKHKNSVK
jgi:hypothetical protein